MKMLLTLLCALFLTAPNANAQSCEIAFSDDFGLSLLDPSMAYGFLYPTGGGIIWYYNQCGGPASDNWLYFDEDPGGGFPGGIEYGHFHIPFDDPTINCYTTTPTYPNGVSGKQMSGSPCVAINPFITPRTLLPHRPDGILRIRYLAHTGEPLRYILPNAIRVIGPTPVSVLFQAANGSWWVWNDLTAGNWILAGALPARRAFVLSNVGNVGPPWQIADLGITLGDFYTPPPLTNLICLLCFQNQYKTVRDFLSTLTINQRSNPQTTTSAEVPGSEASVPAAIQSEQSARPISEQEALRLLLRPRHDRDDHDENLDEILDKILGAEGTERQVLIAEYLLAVSKLPRLQQAFAQRRLVALFEPKR